MFPLLSLSVCCGTAVIFMKAAMPHVETSTSLGTLCWVGTELLNLFLPISANEISSNPFNHILFYFILKENVGQINPFNYE